MIKPREPKTPDLQFRKDLLKLCFLFGTVIGTFTVFAITPALSGPTLISLVVAILLSPIVAAVERRGYSRILAITLLFVCFGLTLAALGAWGFRAGVVEWSGFSTKVPEFFLSWIQRMKIVEHDLKAQYPFLKSIQITDSILNWGSQTGQWFADQGPSLMSQLVSWLFIVPPLSFILLNEGPTIRKRFFQLVPNRFFESFFLIITDIFKAISDYLRAKLLEALLVGLLVTVGLFIIGAPYSLVLGALAGITNIVPYLGPFLGAIPAILIVGFEAQNNHLIFAVALVFVFANVIDTILIFPLVVAKLVNLHPLILIATVAIGQRYYGLVGMLISIPIATALKVVLQEIYYALYEHRPLTPFAFEPVLHSPIDSESGSVIENRS